MDFKEKIAAYQTEGNRAIIHQIMSDVEIDFLRGYRRERFKNGKPSGGISISLPETHQYISYRIRAMREMIMRRYSQPTNNPYLDEFHRYLSIIYIDFDIKFDATIYDQDYYIYYFNLTPALFTQLEAHMGELEERFSPEEFRHFQRMFKTFKEAEDKLQATKQARLAELYDTSVAALEYALKYVDTSKDERQIVKYINQAFISKFSDAEIKRNGLRRIQRKNFAGKRVDMVVKVEFPENVDRVIFGANVRPADARLTDEQWDFLRKVRAIVEADKFNGDTENYTCDEYGEARINKKYIAKRLGVSADVVRQKVYRIKKRVT